MSASLAPPVSRHTLDWSMSVALQELLRHAHMGLWGPYVCMLPSVGMNVDMGKPCTCTQLDSRGDGWVLWAKGVIFPAVRMNVRWSACPGAVEQPPITPSVCLPWAVW